MTSGGGTEVVLQLVPLTVAGVQKAAEELSHGLEALDMDCLSGADAALLMRALEELARVATAGRLTAARRAAQANEWRRGGRRATPEQWLAEQTGGGVGEARRELATAERLAELPEVAGAFRRGEISPEQAAEVARAATASPEMAGELLEVARRGRLRELRDACRKVRHQADGACQDAERAARLWRRRRAFFTTDDEGMALLHAWLPPERMGRLKRAVDAETDRVFAAARAEGRREGTDAYRADALLALVEAGLAGGGVPGKAARRPPLRSRMLVRVDLSALQRGWTERGERCDIPGVGPVPVDTARRLLGESLLTVLVTKGQEIATVCSLGRHVPTVVDLGLRWRDGCCVVPGCGQTVGLERDHWETPYGGRGPTSLANLALLCRRHHHQKTYEGWVLDGGPGAWCWRGPDDPDPPVRPEAAERGGSGGSGTAVGSPAQGPGDEADPPRLFDSS